MPTVAGMIHVPPGQCHSHGGLVGQGRVLLVNSVSQESRNSHGQSVGHVYMIRQIPLHEGELITCTSQNFGYCLWGYSLSVPLINLK